VRGELGWTGVIGLVLVLSPSGCATKMYPGPARPERETAVLQPNETEIRMLDGRDVRTVWQLTVLPGAHELAVRPSGGGYETDAVGAVCFWAEAGHRYEIRPGRFDIGWRAAIVDEATGAALPTVPGAAAQSCLPEIAARASQPSWAGATVPPAPALPPVSPIGSALRRSGFAIAMDSGLSFGWGRLEAINAAGDASVHHAGAGLSVSLAACWTPVWFGDGLGIGIGGSIGYKSDQYSDLDNDQPTLSSFPATGEAHAFVRLDDRLVLFVRGGVEKDLDVTISGGGFDTGFRGDIGGFGEASLLYVSPPETPHFAMALGLRYTALTYISASGGETDAGSVGLRFMVTSSL
jgi:hypothetical protein